MWHAGLFSFSKCLLCIFALLCWELLLQSSISFLKPEVMKKVGGFNFRTTSCSVIPAFLKIKSLLPWTGVVSTWVWYLFQTEHNKKAGGWVSNSQSSFIWNKFIPQSTLNPLSSCPRGHVFSLIQVRDICLIHITFWGLWKLTSYRGKKKYPNVLDLSGFLHYFSIKWDLIFILVAIKRQTQCF